MALLNPVPRKHVNINSFEVHSSLPFCNCDYPKSTEVAAFKGNIHDQISCKCGENEDHEMQWIWDRKSAHPECFLSGPNVTFHPVYSQGTSVIRGEQCLQPKMIHYWEIKIMTSLAGTDVMLGIGTEKVNLLAHQYKFASVLGLDDQSWGYSYRGILQHNGCVKQYGKKFSQGCIIGFYLDLIRGYLEIYFNRRSLGIAYKNIPTDNSIKLYPMTCSTQAKSSIRLINSTSCEDSLQFQTMQVISKRPKLIQELDRMPGLKSLTNKLWFLRAPFRYSNELDTNDLTLEDEAILMSRKTKKLKVEDDDIDVFNIYQNLNIKHRPDTISDDDGRLTSDFPLYYYCEH